MPLTPTPTERFANFVRWLTLAVTDLSGGDRLSHFLIGLITERIRLVKQRFNRIAARVEAGSYAPRRSGPRRKSAHHRPRTPSKLPTHRGWLMPLLPRAVEFRGHLEGLLREPEMAALLAAAPASMRRPIRSLCWMLRLEPPSILAPPAKPRPPRKTPPAPKTPPPEREHPQPPAWMPRHRPWSLARIRGSPQPAQRPPRRS